MNFAYGVSVSDHTLRVPKKLPLSNVCYCVLQQLDIDVYFLNMHKLKLYLELRLSKYFFIFMTKF
jgi:hypothetical protein